MNDRIATGIAGLDDVLSGGLPRHRLYLVQGDPGVGKTTLALQFLLAGVEAGERVLYVTLSETKDELAGVAASHGWSLEGLDLFELSEVEKLAVEAEPQSIFPPSELELARTVSRLLEVVEELSPSRVVFDSLSELRLMAGDALRYRRQILALKSHFSGRCCTVMLIDDRTDADGDQQLRSLAHGVIELDRIPADFGSIRRRMQVAKLRGVRFREGYHDYLIREGGIAVFPRLVAAEHRLAGGEDTVLTGVPELDQLLGGGLARGTALLLLGPAGIGKTTVALQFVLAAAERGERSAVYLFDERPSTLVRNVVGERLVRHIEQGRVEVEQVDPAERSPGEFIDLIRRSVEDRGTRTVVIDGLEGFQHAMPGEKHLLLQLHELAAYLGQRGVTTILTKVTHGMMGGGGAGTSGADVSYLADAALLFRYFEHRGAICQAVSVFKKRGGRHERTIREIRIGPDGLSIGPPLDRFRGVLTGVPVYEGERLEAERS